MILFVGANKHLTSLDLESRHGSRSNIEGPRHLPVPSSREVDVLPGNQMSYLCQGSAFIGRNVGRRAAAMV